MSDKRAMPTDKEMRAFLEEQKFSSPCNSSQEYYNKMLDSILAALDKKVNIPWKAIEGAGEAAVIAARMGGVPGVPIKTILESWGIEVVEVFNESK
jgi:phosphomannomutase